MKLKNILLLFLITLCISYAHAQLITSPWAGKTPAEIEEIIESVALHEPTAL